MSAQIVDRVGHISVSIFFKNPTKEYVKVGDCLTDQTHFLSDQINQQSINLNNFHTFSIIPINTKIESVVQAYYQTYEYSSLRPYTDHTVSHSEYMCFRDAKYIIDNDLIDRALKAPYLFYFCVNGDLHSKVLDYVKQHGSSNMIKVIQGKLENRSTFISNSSDCSEEQFINKIIGDRNGNDDLIPMWDN